MTLSGAGDIGKTIDDESAAARSPLLVRSASVGRKSVKDRLGTRKEKEEVVVETETEEEQVISRCEREGGREGGE